MEISLLGILAIAKPAIRKQLALALPPASCVALGRSLNLFELQLSYL